MTGHLEPVQFLFHPMKGIVTDLVACPHRENGLPGRLEGSAMDFGVGRMGSSACVSIWPFVCQTSRETLPDDLRDWRLVMLEARQPRAQCAFSRCTQFTADRIIVMDFEHTQQRLQCQSLNH